MYTHKFVFFTGMLLMSAQVWAQKTVTARSESFDLKIKPVRFAVANNYVSRDIEMNLDTVDLEKLAYTGKYYALVVGVSDYTDRRLNLKKPEQDAMDLKNLLTKLYNFNESEVMTLQSPRRADILDAFAQLRLKLTPSDNLLIFYAGHGYYDASIEQGYWLPSDATRDSRSNWVSNSDIRDYIKGIPSKHTLLITDACFGGSIFSGSRDIRDASASIKALYAQRSRQAITSGNLTEVPDNSVFMKLLLEKLKDNSQQFLSVGEFFGNFKVKVMDSSNGNTTPQSGVISSSGHDGGDFIFVKRKK